MSLPNALSLFCLPKKGATNQRLLSQPVRDQKRALFPMLPRARPTRPSLGKEAIALFFWLVLSTAPYSLIINALRLPNLIVHVYLVPGWHRRISERAGTRSEAPQGIRWCVSTPPVSVSIHTCQSGSPFFPGNTNGISS